MRKAAIEFAEKHELRRCLSPAQYNAMITWLAGFAAEQKRLAASHSPEPRPAQDSGAQRGQEGKR